MTTSSTRVLALGGSTTYGWGVDRPEEAWPRQMERLLRNEGHEVEVINAGLPYATSAELLASYVFRHRHLRPDVVLIHTGGNDVAPMFFPGYEPEYTHFRASAGTGARPNERRWLQRSGFIRLLYAKWLARFTVGTYLDQPGLFTELDPQVALQRVRATEPLGFSRNIEALVRSVKADGGQVVLVGFVQARKEELSRNRPDLKGFEEAMYVGVEKTLAALRAVGESEEVLHFDLRTEEFEEEWFTDNCHLDVAGQARKAELIGRRLGEVLGAL